MSKTDTVNVLSRDAKIQPGITELGKFLYSNTNYSIKIFNSICLDLVDLLYVLELLEIGCEKCD